MSPEEIARNRAILARRHQDKLEKEVKELMDMNFGSAARLRLDPCLIPLPRSPVHSRTEPKVIDWSARIKEMMPPPPRKWTDWKCKNKEIPVEPVEHVEEKKVVVPAQEAERRVRAWADVVKGVGKKDLVAPKVE
jgi:hypothetical protein